MNVRIRIGPIWGKGCESPTVGGMAYRDSPWQGGRAGALHGRKGVQGSLRAIRANTPPPKMQKTKEKKDRRKLGNVQSLY